MKQGITIAPHNVGATRRCNFAAKPRLRPPLRPQDQANVYMTCAMSRFDGSLGTHGSPPHIVRGRTFGGPSALRGAAPPTASCRRSRRSRRAKQEKARSTQSGKQCHTSTQKFYEKLGESASLSPSSCSALSDRKHGKMVRSLESLQQWIEVSISKIAKRCWRSWA